MRMLTDRSEFVRNSHWRDLGAGGFEEVVEGVEGLGDDVDVGDDGHEVGVADPAGDDVPVEVAGETGTGDVAEVEADVEAAGVHEAAHQLEESLDFVLAFEEFFLGEIGEIGFVLNWCNEEVAVVVGVPIEDGDGRFAPVEDEVFGVVVFGEITTEETAIGLFVVLGSGDVIESPGSPELLEEDLMVGAGLRRRLVGVHKAVKGYWTN